MLQPPCVLVPARHSPSRKGEKSIVPSRQPGDRRVEPNRIEPNRIETNRINSNRIANACALNGAQTSGRSCGNLQSKARCNWACGAQLGAHKPPIAPLGRMMRRLGDNLIKMLGAPGFSFPTCSHALVLPRAMASWAPRTNWGARQPLHALCMM